MRHLIVFTETLDNVTDNAVTPAADSQISIQNTDDVYLPSEWNKIVMVAILAVTVAGTRFYATSPKLTEGRIAPIFTPVNAGTEFPSTPIIHDFRNNPLEIDPTEALNVKADYSDVASAERVFILMWVGDGVDEPVPESDVKFTAKATSTTAAVANTWTATTITFADKLPAGRYAIVGMRYEAANAIAARILDKNKSNRDGCIGYDTLNDHDYNMFRYGNLGVLSEFEHNVVPNIEVMNISTDAAHTFFFDLVQVRKGVPGA